MEEALDETQLRCLYCKKPHNGRFGAGKFCNVSCSRRVGARARWDARKQLPAPPRLTALPPEDSACDLGLMGERVTVRFGKTVIRGNIAEYEPATDRHRIVDGSGRSRWMLLRKSSVEFLDEP